MVCVGFIGIEVFDIVLYIGHALAKLKYPVLIVDLSDSGALKNSIYHGMDIDSRKEIVHYRNLNYIRRIPDEKELKEFEEGVVFIVYGFNYTYIRSVRHDYINIVANQYTHILDKINNLIGTLPPESQDLRLLVRDILSPDDLEKVKNSITFAQNLNCINYLYMDFNDYENAIKCQRTQTVKYSKVSGRMKKIILGEIDFITSLLNQPRLQVASVVAEGEI